jgi:glycosyltransferase involved in cell wall biosynthesis
MQKVEESVLASDIVEARIIPNGVDLRVFQPANQKAARAALNIPQDAKVLLFTANGIRKNIWKDFKTMRAAIIEVSHRLREQNLVFIALGEDAPAERFGQAEVRFVPYQKDPRSVARYYQAADIYLHSSRADTFPTTVLEALACGTPVVATAVGGIPEQVKGLELPQFGLWNSGLNRYGMDEATGVLVPGADAQAMAAGIEQLSRDESLRRLLGRNAAQDAVKRFDLQRQVDEFLGWYREILHEAGRLP